MKKIKQVYHPYWEWECWHSGFFAPIKAKELEGARRQYSLFLSDLELFQAGIDKVFLSWPRSCEHFLTNASMNRVAFIGQSAMCISKGISSIAKGGFLQMSQDNQRWANDLALRNLERWINEFAEKN